MVKFDGVFALLESYQVNCAKFAGVFRKSAQSVSRSLLFAARCLVYYFCFSILPRSSLGIDFSLNNIASCGVNWR